MEFNDEPVVRREHRDAVSGQKNCAGHKFAIYDRRGRRTGEYFCSALARETIQTNSGAGHGRDYFTFRGRVIFWVR